MGISKKFLGIATIAGAMAIAPVAAGAGGASATATPKSVKAGKMVELKVTGMRGGERIKATESIPSQGGQIRTLYPTQRTSHNGVIIVNVKAQLKGRHNWTFVGRSSRRTAKTYYVVR